MSNLISSLAGIGLALYARLLARTIRLRMLGEQHLLAALKSDRSTIISAWHGQTHLLYPVIRGRLNPSRMVLMVVDGHRGDTLRSFARAEGVQSFPVGMEDESMSGARNLLRLIQLLKSGKLSYVTPDGPDGPARVAKPGVAFLATRAEAQIVPVGAHGSCNFHLRRWDRYALPLPFSRVTVVARPPVPVSRREDREGILERLSAELDAAVAEAQSAAARGINPEPRAIS